MPAKNWDADFRREAIGASLQLLAAAGIEEPTEAGFSYCVPVHDRPIVGWTPGES